MGQRRKKKSKKIAADDVLAGRVTVGIQALLELIHDINPTDKGLSERETAARYNAKSRLQSLLLRKHPGTVRISPDEGGEVIAIHHRYGAGDACHAVVSELDEDVRSWVRRQLDEETAEPQVEEAAPQRSDAPSPVPQEEPPEDLAELDVTELLKAGQDAQEQWDYDRARAAYSLALDKSSSASVTASALLELLVDTLGVDHDALEVEARLSREARRNEEVRSLLGVAAARVGDLERAAELVNGLEGVRAAGVCSALARSALDEEDESEARRWLERAQELGANPVELANLRDAMSKLRVDQRAPLEEEAQKAYNAGDLTEAESISVEVRRMWPESRVAARILGKIEQLRKEALHRRLIEEANEVLAEGDEVRGLALLKEARSLSQDEDLSRRITELERRDRSRKEARQVATIVERLHSDDLEPVLLDYLELSEPLRGRVRGHISQPALEWLEEFCPPLSKAKARAAVRAVLALLQAQQELGERPEAVNRLLAPYSKLLGSLEAATELKEDAERRLMVAAKKRAAEALEAAHNAFEQRDYASALSTLDAVDRELLPEDSRAAALHLEQVLATAEELERLTKAVPVLAEGGDILGARDSVRKIMRLAGDTDGVETWQKSELELTEALRAHWCIEEVTGPGLDLIAVDPKMFYESPPVDLSPSGESVVLAHGAGNWLFLWVVGVDTGEVRRAVRLLLPEPMTSSPSVTVDGDSVWVVGVGVLQLALTDWDVRLWASLVSITAEDEVIEKRVILLGTRYLWVTTERRGDARMYCRIIDLEGKRLHRDLGQMWNILPILGGSTPLVLAVDRHEGMAIHEAHGARVDMNIPSDLEVLQIQRWPDARGLVLLVCAHEAQDEELVVPLGVVQLADDGTRSEAYVIEGSNHESSSLMAISSESNLIFVAFNSFGSQAELIALQPQGEGLEQLWRTDIHTDTVLVRDAAGVHVVAVTRDEHDEVRVHRLGVEPPLLTIGDIPVIDNLPDMEPPFYCNSPVAEVGSRALAIRERLKALPAGSRGEWIRSHRRKHDEDPIAHITTASAMWALEQSDESYQLLCEIHEAFPDNAQAVLVLADAEAERGSWQRVVELLGSIEEPNPEEVNAAHLHHLLGVAHFHLGDLDEAVVVWTAGLKHDVVCGLRAQIALASALESRTEAGGEGSMVQRLVAATRQADQHLAEDEPEKAIEVLHKPWVWAAREMQSFARLVEAHLRIEDDDSKRIFVKTLALATYHALPREDRLLRKNLPLREMTWNKSRLFDLAQRAFEWLDEQYVAPFGASTTVEP